MRGSGEGKWVMGIEEGTCWAERWVLNVSDEPQESTPQTKSTLSMHCMLANLTRNYSKRNKKEKKPGLEKEPEIYAYICLWNLLKIRRRKLSSTEESPAREMLSKSQYSH